MHEEGFVAGYDDDTHEVMRALLKEKLAPLAASGFAVAPSIENLHRIAAVTNETSLVKLLKRFIHNIDVPDGFFYPRITEEQSERAIWLDTLTLTVAEKFMLSLVPISTKVPSLQGAWEHWAMSLAKKQVCKLEPEGGSLRWLNLQEVEDACRRYSAYAWIAYREPEYFPSVELAQELSRAASERVDSILQAQNAAARKRRGGKRKRIVQRSSCFARQTASSIAGIFAVVWNLRVAACEVEAHGSLVDRARLSQIGAVAERRGLRFRNASSALPTPGLPGRAYMRFTSAIPSASGRNAPQPTACPPALRATTKRARATRTSSASNDDLPLSPVMAASAADNSSTSAMASGVPGSSARIAQHVLSRPRSSSGSAAGTARTRSPDTHSSASVRHSVAPKPSE